MFSAYMLDQKEGWCAVHRLPLKTAVRYCKEYRRDWDGVLVAIVPDGSDPKPYLDFVVKVATDNVLHGSA